MDPETKIPQNPNSEIEQALREFEEKSQAEQTPKNTFGGATSYEVPKEGNNGIRFETDNYRAELQNNRIDTSPRMVRFIMKLSGGMIKKQKTAEYVLFVLSMLMFGASLYFFFT